MTSGFVLGPGEGSAYGFHGSVAVIKASGEDTFGQFGVIESVYPAALSVHEHVHAGEDEVFYLLGGEMEVFCGEDRWTPGAPGQIGGESLVQSAGRYSTAVPFVFHDPFSKASILMMMWSTSSW
jgi:hypothetical protein